MTKLPSEKDIKKEIKRHKFTDDSRSDGFYHGAEWMKSLAEKEIERLELELKKLGEDKMSNDKDYIELSKENNRLEKQVSLYKRASDLINEIDTTLGNRFYTSDIKRRIDAFKALTKEMEL